MYYIVGDFSVDSNSCLRPSGALGDGSGGAIFYFTGGSVSVDSNSGSKCGTAFVTAGYAGTNSLLYGVKCTSTSQIPGNLPATLTGNVMLAPCSGTYGDPLGAADPLGVQRGILFFQDRSTPISAAGSTISGSSASTFDGALYFPTTTLTYSGGSSASGYMLVVANKIDLRLAPALRIKAELDASRRAPRAAKILVLGFR